MEAKWEPKGTKRGPKDGLREPEECPKGAKMEPKGNERATKIHRKIIVEEGREKGWFLGVVWTWFGPGFWSHFRLKMHSKFNEKFDVEKVWKCMRKCSQNDAKTRSKSMTKL